MEESGLSWGYIIRFILAALVLISLLLLAYFFFSEQMALQKQLPGLV